LVQMGVPAGLLRADVHASALSARIAVDFG
jgi:hypothetical protein